MKVPQEMIDRLHEGNYSCIIRNGEGERVFSGRGVSDLYKLVTRDPDFLEGALIADKVIGKGAAALLVLGGIGAVYADLMSVPAKELFEKHGIPVACKEEVPHIFNRSRTGNCPVEILCSKETEPHKMLSLIETFLRKMNLGN